MSKVATRKKKSSSPGANGSGERDLQPLAPPERHVVQGASAAEILKTYGITEKQVKSARRRLKDLGLL